MRQEVTYTFLQFNRIQSSVQPRKSMSLDYHHTTVQILWMFTFDETSVVTETNLHSHSSELCFGAQQL